MKIFLFFLLIGVNILGFTDTKIEIPQPADLGLVKDPHVLEVVESAQKAVRNTPNAAEAWGKLGHVYLIHGWNILTEPCYRRASALAPDEFRWHYFLGRVTSYRNPEEAVDIFTGALKLDATYAPAHLYLASALRSLRRFDEAESHLERAKHLQPDNPFSDLWLGEIALAQQQIEDAKEHLHCALNLNPEQSEAHALLAQVYFKLKEPVFARQHARAARQPSQYTELADPLWSSEPLISSSPKDVKAWLEYGSDFIRMKRYNEAFAALERAQVLLENDEWVDHGKDPAEFAYLRAQVYYFKGYIHYQIGEPAKAIQTYQKTIRIIETQQNDRGSATVPPQEPQPIPSKHLSFFADVYANLAMVYEEQDQIGQAIKQYQKALRLLPTEPVLHRNLAAVYWKTERYAEAEHHYKSVIAHDTMDVQTLYRLGFISLMKTDYVEAISQFERVLELDTAYIEAYRGLGYAHTELGNSLEAIIAFEMVLELDPRDPFAQEMLKHLRGVR